MSATAGPASRSRSGRAGRPRDTGRRAAALGLVAKRIDVLAGHALMDDVAASREADLALELEGREGAGAVAAARSASSSTMSALLPPSSSDTFLSRAPASSPDAPASCGRAGERHHVHVRVGHQRLADVGAADDDLEQALGQARFAEDRLEHRAAADGVCGSGFRTTALPKRECRSDDAHAQHGWRVPRRDRADHANRDPPDHRQPLMLTVGTSEPYGCHGIVAAPSTSP